VEGLDPSTILKNLLQIDSNTFFIENRKIEIKNKIHIFAVGKAASYEAKACLDYLESCKLSNNIEQVVALTKYGHTVNDEKITQLEGPHPIISNETLENTEFFIEKLSKVERDDVLLFFLSGGTSSLLEIPKEGVEVDFLISEYKRLVYGDESISIINNHRKKLSKIKNGGLRNYIKCENIIHFITCDVPSSELADVGSGPLINDQMKYDDIHLFNGPAQLLKRIKEKFSFLRIGKIYDDSIDSVLNELKLNLPSKGEGYISGGEAFVKLGESVGLGGRNIHMVLSIAQSLYGEEKNRDIKILSLATDGDDGNSLCAGAYIDYDLYNASKIDPKKSLGKFDTYNYFKDTNSLIHMDEKFSNVMDIRIIWC
jgi:glycerate-2-kinase